MSCTGIPALAAICETARLWSRRIMEVMLSLGKSGALLARIAALVLAGLPTTTTLAPLDLEYLGVCGKQIAPFHSLRARAGTDQHGRINIAKSCGRIVGRNDIRQL